MSTACDHCRRTFWGQAFGRCNHLEHSPGGREKGTLPFRSGKTARDHKSGAWRRRFQNRRNDSGRAAQ